MENSGQADTKSVAVSTRLVVPLFILLFVLQCAWFIRTQSFTNDEPEHIIAGLEAWRFGEFKQWHDQPPLARLFFAVPLLKTNWSYKYPEVQVRPVTPSPEVWLWPTRSVMVIFGVVLLWMIWDTARRLFSERTANIVLAFAALSPDLVTHFSLATMDGIGCLCMFASILQWIRYWYRPTRVQAALLGLSLGLLLLAKFNSVPLFALIVLLVLVLAPNEIRFHPQGLQVRAFLRVIVIACLTVWCGYFFHVSKVTFADQSVCLHFPGYSKLLRYDMPTPKTSLSIYIPACEWLTGLGMVVAHNIEGHRSFFLGQYSTSGWKLYFPVAMMLKWPLIILLAAVSGVFVAIRGRKLAENRDLLLMSVFPIVYMLFAITSHINIGVRHVLPVYPFVLLFAGAAIEGLRRAHWGMRKTGIALALLLVLQAADVARYAPDYLSYFTVLVSPTHTWKYLSDSNTDWGQGMVALRRFQEQHQDKPIHLAYVGEVGPALYGIRYARMHEEERPSGLVVVSATHLSGELLKNHYAYRWLLQYPLVTVLDHSLYVFDVPEEANRLSTGPVTEDSRSFENAPLCTPRAPLCHTQNPEAAHGDGWDVIYAWP